MARRLGCSSSSSSSRSRVERNLAERNRRMQMKHLLGSLASLLPQPSKLSSACKILEEATGYIKQLQQRNEEIVKRKKALSEGENLNLRSRSRSSSSSTTSAPLPVMNITNLGSTLEVNLVTGLNNNFMLYEIMTALQEEGTQVVQVSFQNAADRIIYTIKSEVMPSIGVETSRVEERLKEVIF